MYGAVVKKIKESAPSIPIAAVVTQSAVKGIEYGTYALPQEVDWIGFDAYGCWGQAECAASPGGKYCCWENRTVPHNLGVLKAYAQRRGPHTRIVVVPDGVFIAAPATPTPRHGLPPRGRNPVRGLVYLLRHS